MKPDDRNKQKLDDKLEDAIKRGQEAILSGARQAQRTYRDFKRGELMDINDSSLVAFGAGLGAGLGLGAALLFRFHPIGRAIAIAGGALGGAYLGRKERKARQKARLNQQRLDSATRDSATRDSATRDSATKRRAQQREQRAREQNRPISDLPPEMA